MIYNSCYSNGDRGNIIEFLRKNKKKKVLDIGYSARNWDSEFVTHYVDVIRTEGDKKAFIGDINFPDVWSEIDSYVKLNGKFDFCICTHTLEDIINPVYVSRMINKFCSSGFIAMPSKFIEMTRNIEGPYRGYIHHRYIFNFENDGIVGYPKFNFIEYDSRFDILAYQSTELNREMQFFWENDFKLEVVNNNYMGPDLNSVLNYYTDLLQ